MPILYITACRVSSRRTWNALAIALVAAFVAHPSSAETFKVGPGREYDRPSAVTKLVHDGDVVEIDAGKYEGDVAVWKQNNLTLRGTGGRAHLVANGESAQGKAIWVITGRGTTVEHVEFSGATVKDGNGAGIRAEGADLTLRDCYFHHNQNGILGGAGRVLIEASEFANNGSGDGYTHNIYLLDRVERFTLRYSYSHHANVGHNVKSRARENYIEYNRLMDEADGRSSYTIDLPNGGLSVIRGNLIQQGPRTENPVIVSYGAEGYKGPRNELYFVHNTVVNDADGGVFLRVAEGDARAIAVNNLFVGPGRMFNGNVESKNNLSPSTPKLSDRAHYDYRLAAGSPAIDAGVDPGKLDQTSLAPTEQYVHPLKHAARRMVGSPDVGAYEYDAGGRR